MKRSGTFFTGYLAVVVIFLAGCATGSVKTAPDVEVKKEAYFYPPLPNSPRIQYLTTFSSERDIVPVQEKNDFAKFILGEEDDLEGQKLLQPYGAAMYKGKLYVADTAGRCLVVFDLAKQQFYVIPGSGNGRFSKPINISIDVDGTKYITDTAANQVLVYDSTDRFVNAFGTEGQFKPVGLAISGEKLYVTDIKNHQVHVLEKRTGKTLFKFGKWGPDPGDLFNPTNVAVGPDGDVYVAETGNYRIQRFTSEGKSVRVYGSVGTVAGNFARPKGVAVDKDGRIYVVDNAFQNIQIFNNGGGLLSILSGEGAGKDGFFNLPVVVNIDYDNVAYFKRYAHEKFTIEYVFFVVSQFIPNKVDVFGFGKMSGYDYPPDNLVPVKPAP